MWSCFLAKDGEESQETGESERERDHRTKFCIFIERGNAIEC